jgi:hypothetical protein
MISSQELADGIRFAASRAVAAMDHVQEWDYQLGHQWTTADAFRHVAATAGGLEGFYPLLDGTVLNAMGVAEIAASNAGTIGGMDAKTRDELRAMIVEGAEASAAFAATLDGEDLAQDVELGGYKMPKAEIVAQIWIHHQIAHSYEASARWPIL